MTIIDWAEVAKRLTQGETVPAIAKSYSMTPQGLGKACRRDNGCTLTELPAKHATPKDGGLDWSAVDSALTAGNDPAHIAQSLGLTLAELKAQHQARGLGDLSAWAEQRRAEGQILALNGLLGKARTGDHRAFVLWQRHVSAAWPEEAPRLAGSSMMPGHIMPALYR